jgi:hypothetical protein
MAHHADASHQPRDNRGSGPGRGPGIPSIGEAIAFLREALLRVKTQAALLENASDYTAILQTLESDIDTLAAITPIREPGPTPIEV